MLSMSTTLMKFALIILISMLFSCTKGGKYSDAGKISGTFKGLMYINLTPYENYLVKIKKLSKDKIQVSCESSPSAFATFEGNVDSVNGNITMYSNPAMTLVYWNRERLQISMSGISFFGDME